MARFIAAMAGMQVALVCPTTLRARQHYNTFKERFQGFPIEIGRLSRLVPAAEAKETKEGIAAGKVDIVIGTPALLAKGLAFRNLGLVIVRSEEHTSELQTPMPISFAVFCFIKKKTNTNLLQTSQMR